MKNVIALGALLILGLGQSAFSAGVPFADPLESLSKKMVDSDVRTVIVGRVEVAPAQADQCNPAGVYDVVELQVQKTTDLVKGKNGKDQLVRTWMTVNTYKVNAQKVGVPFSGARLSDAPCVK